MTTLIVPRRHDLGGFQVRRAVPSLQARSVGPFVFVDHMGPALFEPGRGNAAGFFVRRACARLSHRFTIAKIPGRGRPSHIVS